MELTFFLVARVVLFWIWDQDSADGTGMFQLFLISAYSLSPGSLCFSLWPASEQSGIWQEFGVEHSWDTWPKLTTGTFPAMRDV